MKEKLIKIRTSQFRLSGTWNCCVEIKKIMTKEFRSGNQS